MDVFNDITLFIPTHNRHSYLKRLLEYYKDTPINIVIGDSSETKYSEQINLSQTRYFHFPNTSFGEKIYQSILNVKTKYIVICADDDFILTSGISTCLKFLKENPDYSSVNGYYIGIQKHQTRVLFSPKYLHSVGLDINQEIPSMRIKTMFSNQMTTFYSVQFTENILKSFEYSRFHITNYYFQEFMAIFFSLIHGKYKVLPVFYGVREISAQSSGAITVSVSDIISLESNSEEYRYFINCIADYLQRYELILSGESQKIIEGAMTSYVEIWEKRCALEKNTFDNPSRLSVFKEKIRMLPCIGKLIINAYNKHIGFFRFQHILINQTKGIDGFPFFEKEGKKELVRIKKYFKMNKT